MQNLIVFTDGGARGNPGPAAIGVVIKHKTHNMEHGTNEEKIIAQFGKRIGETTNNVAEYMAVIEALQWIKKHTTHNTQHTTINFVLDSKLVVNQLNGYFKIKDARLRDLLMKIRELEADIGSNITYQLIPREKNYLADNLVNKTLDNCS